MIAAAVTFTVTFASAVQAPTWTGLAEKYGAGRTVATLPYSLFLVGLALGTLSSRLCGLVMGRKVIYIVCVPLFAALTVAAAFVDIMSGIIVCRLLAGVFGGTAMSQTHVMVTDLWTQDERTAPLLLSSIMPLLGPVAGILVGADVFWLEGYRWTQYVVLFAFAGCMVPAVCMSETSRTARPMPRPTARSPSWSRRRKLPAWAQGEEQQGLPRRHGPDLPVCPSPPDACVGIRRCGSWAR